MSLSGFDSNGLPRIDKLDFVLAARNFRLSDDEFQELLDRVLLIHDLNLTHLMKKSKDHG